MQSDLNVSMFACHSVYQGEVHAHFKNNDMDVHVTLMIQGRSYACM